MIETQNCENILFEKIFLTDSMRYHGHFQNTTNIVIQNAEIWVNITRQKNVRNLQLREFVVI